MQCFVMIEIYLNGCNAAFTVAGVTLDQSYAYTWLKSEAPEFVSREVKVVPFYETAP